MKTFFQGALILTSILLTTGTLGQAASQFSTADVPIVSPGAVPPNSGWQPRPKDWNSTEWIKTEMITNPVTGGLVPHIRRYTEIAGGLNFIENGNWQPSSDLITVLTNASGAAALRGPTKVYFNVSTATADPTITMVTASNAVIKITPLALYYLDTQSGQSVLLASVRQVDGELVPPNRVVYRSALDAVDADISFTYTRGAFESDLIFKESPAQPPEYFGLNPATTKLQLVHLIEGPVPTQIPRIATGGLIDTTLDYNQELHFPQGYAFSTGDLSRETNLPLGAAAQISVPSGMDTNQVPVGKRLIKIGNAWGLAEDVRWLDVLTTIW